MESVVEICKEVLSRLSQMGFEKNETVSTGQLIFPSKSDNTLRISEQELRQVFIEVFNETKNGLYYSIETPTINNYSFGKNHDDIKISSEELTGQSALLDMCIFEKENDQSHYTRLLNIEFKHDNVDFKNFSKDILKLMHEKENGAFILLLENTNSGTLINNGEKRRGAIDKLIQSFNIHKLKEQHWNGNEQKYIELIILSLEDKNNLNKKPLLWHRKILKKDLDTIKADIVEWLKVED
ncbi:MAG: hypothetical protein H7239_02210 [Flavobacterium sp.]|nr:hypothetical protein [Flavobacterium sp.]